MSEEVANEPVVQVPSPQLVPLPLHPPDSLPFPHAPPNAAVEEAPFNAAAAASIATNTSTPKKEAPRKRCCVNGCSNHTKLQRAPPLPKPLPLGVSKERQLTHAKRMLKREEFMERLGRKRDDKSKDLRFCSNHELVQERVTANVVLHDREGNAIETVGMTLDLFLPTRKKKKPTSPNNRRRVIRKRCCVKACTNHFALKRVPPIAKPLELGASRDRQISHAKRLFKRTEFLKRLGYSVLDVEKHPDLRICPNHELETKTLAYTIPILDGYGNEIERVDASDEFTLPVQISKSDGDEAPIESSASVAYGDSVAYSTTVMDPEKEEANACQLAEYAQAAAAAASEATSETLPQPIETIPM